MQSPRGLRLIEACTDCKMQADCIFSGLSRPSRVAFGSIKYPMAFPQGAVLFVEGQDPRGALVVCQGRVKLSAASPDHKNLITSIVGPGRVLGLSAVVTGQPYQRTAEALEPCQIDFVRRQDFINFVRRYPDACLQIVLQLSDCYSEACRELRRSTSSYAASQLADLFLQWAERSDVRDIEGRLTIPLTTTEIAALIGHRRKTVSRVLGSLRRRKIARLTGSVLIIDNKVALREMASVA